MEATGDQQISEELLQNIQSAVGSSTGVIGQVQVIETENGPMTVIFMEEGVESSDIAMPTGQQIGLLSGDNVQYQFMHDGDNYTTQVFGTGHENIMTTSTDSMLTGVNVADQVTTAQTEDQTQFALSDTDTYYITETGEIVKIEGSLLGSGDQQQTFIQSNQAFETQTIMSSDASLVTGIPTVVSEATVVTSQSAIPDSSILSGSFEIQTVLPDTQTVLPDTTVHTGPQDNFEFTAVKLSELHNQNIFTPTGSKSLLSTGSKSVPMSSFTNAVVQQPTGTTKTVQVQHGTGLQTMVYPKQSSGHSAAFTSYVNPVHLTQKPKTQPLTYQTIRKTIPSTVTVKPKEVKVPAAYKPANYQHLVQPSSVQTVISTPVAMASKNVNTQTKYSAKVTSTTLQPAVVKKIAVPTSKQIGTPSINRLVKVPVKQNKLNQVSVTQQRDREVKDATDLLSNVIHAADINLSGAKSTSRVPPSMSQPAMVQVTKATTSMMSVPVAMTGVKNTGPVATSVSDLDMLSMVTQALNSGSLDQLTESLDIPNLASTTAQQTVSNNLEAPLMSQASTGTVPVADTSTMDMDDFDSSLVVDTQQDVASATSVSTTLKQTEPTVSVEEATTLDVEPPILPDSTGSEKPSPSKTEVSKKAVMSEPSSSVKLLTASSAVEKPKMKSIDVPDSDVTIELYADGTLVTKDRAGTNYSKVRLEDLGLDQAMLAGNTDIELLIVQGDGKEVRATINTNILNNKDSGATEKAKVISTSEYKIPKESLTGNELRPYKCSMCPRTFKYYKTFRCHELVHTKAETYTCHLCKRVFARETNLASHLELHQKKAAMGINSVKDKLNRERRAKELLAKSMPKKEWNCTECDSVFTEKSLLREHVSKEHKTDFEKLCEFCDKKFHSEYTLSKHLPVHNGPFSCTHCENKYENRELYMKHMEADHLDKIFKCTICPIPKIILTRQHLEYHLDNRHEGESDETLKPMMDLLYVAECEICGLKFMKKSAHKEHMDMIHLEDRPEQCLFCEQSFMKKSQLHSHVKRSHKNMGLLDCKVCCLQVLGKDFGNHQRIQHEGPYNCEHCKKTFDMRKDLEKHQFDGHDGGFSCRKCDVKFTYSHLLKSHLANHTPGSQTFLCEDCGEAFEIKPQLKSHLVSAHFKGNQTEMLKSHPEMKLVQNALTCYICGDFNFEYKMVFVKHIRDQHFGGDIEQAYRTFPWLKQNFPPPGEPPTCDTCNRQFQNAGALKAHMRSHLPSKSGKKKKGRKQTDSDLTEQDNDIETPDEDEDEDVDFTNIEPRDSEKNYNCKKCDLSFTRQAALQKHVNAQHKKDEVKVALRQLEREETERAMMESHEEMEVPIRDSEVSKSSKRSNKIKTCSKCKEKFTSPEDLAEHVKNAHDESDNNETGLVDNPEAYDMKEKVCNLCGGQQFYSPYGVKRHMRNVHKILVESSSVAASLSVTPGNKSAKKTTPASGKSTGKISSSIFGKKSTASVKNSSETSVSDNSISVQADMDNAAEADQSNDITSFLGRNFNLGKAVKESCNIESVKKKVHRCKECGEAFSREAALKKHLVEHEMGATDDMSDQVMDADESDLQVANYACVECGNTYTTPLGLIHHNRIKHAGAKEQELLALIQETDRLRKIAEEDAAIVKSATKSKKRKLSPRDSTSAHEQASKREKLDEKGLKMYECMYCPSSFKTFQGAMNHEKDCHPDRVSSKSEICSPSTPQYSKTGRLITKSRKLIERFNCAHCTKYFEFESSLKLHIKSVHSTKEAKDQLQKSPTKQVQSKQEDLKPEGYKCQKCDKVFEQFINLRRHQIMKHKEKWTDTDVKAEASESEVLSASGSMIYDCDVCKEKFSVLAAVRQHMKAVHDENDEPKVKVEIKSNTNEQPYLCSVCKSRFASKLQLQGHLSKQHSKLWSKKVHCKICLALFTTTMAMRKHKLTHLKPEGKSGASEESDQLHRCLECDKSFNWKKNLSSHMKLFHSDSDTKTCGICNKVFPNDHSIVEHMKTHDTTFDCAHCNRHFTSELSLKNHETHMHKNVSDSLLLCDICKENFTSKAKLLQHMLTHTSVMGKSTYDEPEPAKELRFSCKKCGKRFLNPWKIRVHNAKVHNIGEVRTVSKVSTISKVQTRRQSADSMSSSDSKNKIKKAAIASKIKKTVAASKTALLKKRKSPSTDVREEKTAVPPKLSPKPGTSKTTQKSIAPPKLRLGPASHKAKFGASKLSPKPAASASLTPKTAKPAESKKDEKSASTPPVTCSICQKDFKKKKYLTKHLKNVHKDKEESKSMKRVKCLYCRECHQMFWTLDQFEVHVKSQHPDRAALELDKQVMERLVKTEIASPNRAGSLKPLEGDDSGVPVQYKCEFCNTIMWTKQSFDDHIIKYHPDHVDEYGIPEDVLAESKPQIELVDDRQDPTNFLNIEVYNDITCDKLSTQPVVKIKKMAETCTKSSVSVNPDVDDDVKEHNNSENNDPEENGEDERDMETEEGNNGDLNTNNKEDSEIVADKVQGDVDEIQKRAMESESVDYLDYVRDKDNGDKSLASIADTDDDIEDLNTKKVDPEKEFEQQDVQTSECRTEHEPIAMELTTISAQDTPRNNATDDSLSASRERAVAVTDHEGESLVNSTDSNALVQSMERNELVQDMESNELVLCMESSELVQGMESDKLVQTMESHELLQLSESKELVQSAESNEEYCSVEGANEAEIFIATETSIRESNDKSTQECVEQLKPILEEGASNNSVQMPMANIELENKDDEDNLDLEEHLSFSEQTKDVGESQLSDHDGDEITISLGNNFETATTVEAEPEQLGTADALEDYVNYENATREADASTVVTDNITEKIDSEKSVADTEAGANEWNAGDYTSSVTDGGYPDGVKVHSKSELIRRLDTDVVLKPVVPDSDQDILGNHISSEENTCTEISDSEPMETE